jgi:acetyltransferase-like isoleucine patch superfamily enzyme
MDSDIHSIKNDREEVTNLPNPIRIGDKVWIGCRSVVLKGSDVPDGCIIGANALVNRKLDVECSIYAGNPANIVKKGISWEI